MISTACRRQSVAAKWYEFFRRWKVPFSQILQSVNDQLVQNINLKVCEFSEDDKTRPFHLDIIIINRLLPSQTVETVYQAYAYTLSVLTIIIYFRINYLCNLFKRLPLGYWPFVLWFSFMVSKCLMILSTSFNHNFFFI